MEHEEHSGIQKSVVSGKVVRKNENVKAHIFQ
jgi:hypothetical protein